MKTITLDITNIETVRALHIYLAYMLGFPAYYGKNLDALYDCLTDVSKPTRIILHTKGVRGEMVAYMPRLMQVFRDCAQENSRLTIIHD